MFSNTCAMTLPEEIAEERGWDCFNKNPTGNALTTTK
jgi:hypothetical protein